MKYRHIAELVFVVCVGNLLGFLFGVASWEVVQISAFSQLSVCLVLLLWKALGTLDA